MRHAFLLALLLPCLAASPTTAPDPSATLAALQKLAANDPPPADLAAQVRALLAQDQQIIHKIAALIDAAKLRALETELAALREKALANIARLAKGDPVTAAKAHHAKLADLTTRLNAANAHKSAIIDALRRREACAALLHRLDQPLDDAAQQRLLTAAVAALGFDLDTALKLPALADVDEPRSDSPQRSVWFYRVCREIEAHNRALEGLNKWERLSAQLLNDYRESLGLFPMEIDPRLVQAARQHSREMVELKYFAHQSPTRGLEQPVTRMRAAGYNAAWRENIAFNIDNPQRAFWVWFGSPGHHQAMTSPEEIALGVGRWDNAWTHTFGHGARLMTRPPEERGKALASISPGGAFPSTAPQPDNAKLPPVTITRTETDIRIIDPRDPSKSVVVPGPTTGQPKP